MPIVLPGAWVDKFSPTPAPESESESVFTFDKIGSFHLTCSSKFLIFETPFTEVMSETITFLKTRNNTS